MTPESPLTARQRRITEAQQGLFDVIIVGGGIHGAAVCREATLRGLRVLLLEASDYASGTSSCSSKMLHGGVRYLEAGNFGLVREALQERAIIRHIAPHLSRSQQFLFPIIPGKTRPAWQMRVGLTMYDLMSRQAKVQNDFPRHRRLESESDEWRRLAAFGLQHNGLFSYSDGQMDDARIVIEHIVDSAELGAITLNYAKVEELSRSSNWTVKWQDQITKEKYTASGKFLVNAAGPWLEGVQNFYGPWKPKWPRPIYSRGTHLLFHVPWHGPGIILPTLSPGRYYFIWPLFVAGAEGTLVGTTDVEVPTNDPTPTEAEKEELLSYLRVDLPRSGLHVENLYSTFSGVRILGAPRKKRFVSSVSRSLYHLKDTAYLALLGGKYTTARREAEHALDNFDYYFGTRGRRTLENLSWNRLLPGGRGYTEIGLEQRLRSEIRKNCPNERKSFDLTRAALRRFGGRAERFSEEWAQDTLVPLPMSPALRAEIRYSIIFEQAVTPEDILRRRLGLALLPEGGADALPIIEEEFLRLAENVKML